MKLYKTAKLWCPQINDCDVLINIFLLPKSSTSYWLFIHEKKKKKNTVMLLEKYERQDHGQPHHTWRNSRGAAVLLKKKKRYCNPIKWIYITLFKIQTYLNL